MAASNGLPYGRQQIDEADIAAVVEVLRSDWLTTGPKITEFEQAIADFVGCQHAVAVSSGTAALHAAVAAAGIGPGDEVILPPLTFAATANAVLYQGGTPVFADVDPTTLLLDPASVEDKITSRSKAIIAVDYAGQPCDYNRLQELAEGRQLQLLADASHSLGASDQGHACGRLAELTTFSFHPVKPVTCGEGGVVTCDSVDHAKRLRRFRNHGISQDHHQRQQRGSHGYDMVELGYNYRMSDLQAALGLSQLNKLPGWIARRQNLADCYAQGLAEVSGIEPLALRSEVSHGFHLYVVRVVNGQRDRLFEWLQQQQIGANVHYPPVHLHSYYRQTLGTQAGLCPVAEAAAQEVLSLPLFPSLTATDIQRVVDAIKKYFREG